MNQNSPRKNTLAIGMFDSGVGGLTVMREIIRMLPHENIIYYADTARIPYGEKSEKAIIRYSNENTHFLFGMAIKLLVVACNTASAYALDSLKRNFNIPIIGVIEAGAAEAVSVTKNKKIAVLATRGTIKSGIYQREIQKQLPDVEIYPLPCPLLVPVIEEKWIDHSITKQIVKEYLGPLKNSDIDTLLLGCTHYPLLRHVIQAELGAGVRIVDSATTCSVAVKKVLEHQRLKKEDNQSPFYKYFVTDDPDKFKTLSKDFLGMPVDQVDQASPTC